MGEGDENNGRLEISKSHADRRRLLPILLGGLALALLAVAGIQIAKLILKSSKKDTALDTGLKIELLTPEQPFVIDRETIAEASEIAERVRELKWLREQRKEKSVTREESARMMDMVETLEGRLRDLEQGITLRVRFTNHMDEGLTLFYGPDKSNNLLVVKGPGATDCSGVVMMTTAEMRHPGSHRLEPGESRELPINELRYGDRDQDRWLITAPGSYSVTLRFVTNDILTSGGILSIDEQTNTVNFKVAEGKQGD